MVAGNVRAGGGKMQPGRLAVDFPVAHVPTSDATIIPTAIAKAVIPTTDLRLPDQAGAGQAATDNADAGTVAGRIRQEVQNELGLQTWQRWFENRAAWSVLDGDVVVSVENPFLQRWLHKQFRDVLNAAARKFLGPAAAVRFDVGTPSTARPHAELQVDSGSAPPTATNQSIQLDVDSNDVESQESNVTGKAGREPLPLPTRRPQVAPVSDLAPPRRRFADLTEFIPGAVNELALAASLRVCQQPGQVLNPFVVCGSVGTGKTLLLEGIYRQVRRQYPSLQVLYLSAEAFTNYFTQALREHTLPAFRQKFRTVGVLLVDDVEFLEGKRAVQEEFLHTFKQLHELGRQVVIASDRHPRLLSKLAEELTTRFLSGMVCRLETPDAATRASIAARKATKMGAEFHVDVLKYVADRFSRNIRELEGALHCLHTWQTMTGRSASVTAVKQVLSDLERDCVRVVKLADVERVVCDAFGVESADLRGARRVKSVSQPRMLAMYLARKHTPAAYSEIGQYFGGRNHSTVISAEKRVDGWMQGDLSVRIATRSMTAKELLESLEQRLLVG